MARSRDRRPTTIELQIRRARQADAATLTEIATESKAYWGYPDRWMRLWREALTITSGYIDDHVVCVAESKGVVQGFYALVGAERKWELEHLWVRPEFMGRGIGRQLFRHAVAHLAGQAPGSVLGIESDPHAEGFYVRMGARRVREVAQRWQGLDRTLPYLELVVNLEPGAAAPPD